MSNPSIKWVIFHFLDLKIFAGWTSSGRPHQVEVRIGAVRIDQLVRIDQNLHFPFVDERKFLSFYLFSFCLSMFFPFVFTFLPFVYEISTIFLLLTKGKMQETKGKNATKVKLSHSAPRTCIPWCLVFDTEWIKRREYSSKELLHNAFDALISHQRNYIFKRNHMYFFGFNIAGFHLGTKGLRQ